MSGRHNLEEHWQQGRAGAVYDDDVYDWPDVSTTGLSTDAGALAFGALDASIAARRSGSFSPSSASLVREERSTGGGSEVRHFEYADGSGCEGVWPGRPFTFAAPTSSKDS